MKTTSKQTIALTIGGIAVSAGTLYYLYKKRVKNLNDPVCILQTFLKEFKNTPDNKLTQMSSKFNQIIDYTLRDLFNSEEDKTQTEINYFYCKNKIQNEGFYECLTCYSKTIEGQKDHKMYDPLFSVNQYCSDCFDHKYHESHVFRKRPYNGNQQCDCGDCFKIPQESFCKNHFGISQDVSEMSTQQNKEIQQTCINVLQEAFNYLFNIKIQKEGRTDGRYHFNFLLNLILQKLSQIISENKSLVRMIVDVFSQPISKQNPIDTSQDDDLVLLNYPTTDSNTSILEYLIRLSGYITSENEIMLSNIIRDLQKFNENFNIFITAKLLKLIKFCILEKSDEQNNVSLCQTPIFESCLSGLQHLNVSYDIIRNNPECYIEAIKYVKHIIKQLKFNRASDYRYIYTFSVIVSQIVQIPSIFQQNFDLVMQYAQELIEFHSVVYERLLLKELDSSEDYSQQFLNKYPQIIGLFEIQKNLLLYFKLLTIQLKQQNNSQQRQQINGLLCRQYYNQIYLAYKRGLDFKNENEEELLHCTACLFPILIYIIVLSSDLINFSQNGIKNAIMESFEFTDKEQYDFFISMISELMKNNIFSAYEYPSSYWRWYLESISKQNTEYQIIQASFESWISTKNFLYDHHILTQQIILLLNNNVDNNIFYSLVQKFIENPQANLETDCEEEEDCDYEFTESHYSQIMIFQCLFDQTPFVNVFDLSNEKRSLKISNSNVEQQVSHSIEQTIQQTLFYNKNELKFFSDLRQTVKKYISIDDVQLRNYLSKFVFIDDVNDKFVVKEETQTSFFNLGRSFNFANQLSSKNLARYQGFISAEFLDNMFLFQQQILIKYFSDFNLLKYFLSRIEIEINNPNFNRVTPSLHSFIVLFGYIIQLIEKKPELFSPEQKNSVSKIQDSIYSEQSKIKILKAITRCQIDQSLNNSQLFNSTKSYYEQQQQKYCKSPQNQN